MMSHCPRHGLRIYSYVSPDVIPDTEVFEPSQLVLVDLMVEGRCWFAITLSKEFATQHGVIGESLDFLEAFSLLGKLGSMCSECCAERWPELIAEMKCRDSLDRKRLQESKEKE